MRISLCSSGTTDMLRGLLDACLFLRGIDARIHTADFGLVHAELLDPDSSTSRFEPRVALIVVGPRDLPSRPGRDATVAEAEALAEEAVRWFLEPARAVHDRCGADVVLTNLHPYPERPLGHFGARSPADANNFIRRVNGKLADAAPPWLHVHDVAALAERTGLDRWLDRRLWFHAKMPASTEAQAELADSLSGHVAGILGRARKAVVVDLDNTLWGGVIGDDGLEGIVLGEGAGDGEAFKAFQLHLRDLARRGVVLAVSSKNEEATARGAFAHPEMVLSLDDFAAFKASWEPKSAAIREIAEELDLGLDAIVFIDDNPAEREEVRRALPAVAVPELPEDPADYFRAIDGLHAFETAQITADDRRRTTQYRARGESRRLERSSSSQEEFLASLEMVGDVARWTPTTLPRVTQLIGKTNQYNLTTKRLGAAEVEERMRSREWVALSLRLRDRFGDHGLVSALWGRIDGATLELEGWIMSCRVLKRRAEHFLFNGLLDEARQLGVGAIVGRYLPTERNAVCREHFADLGFERIEESEEGATLWRVAVSEAGSVVTPVCAENVS